MLPNTDIWGLPSSWETSNISDVGLYNSYIGGKFAPFDTSEQTNSSRRYAITAGVAAGKLTPGQPFDTSCCPWRIKGTSYFLDLKKLCFPDAYTANKSPLYSNKVKTQGVPVAISTLPTNSSYPKITEIDGFWNPDPSVPGVTPVYGTAPLLSLNYKNILLHCKICCSAYNDTEPSDCCTYSVEDYFSNRINSYPIVRGLAFDVYMWTGTTWAYNNYSLFTIIPINAEIEKFEAGTIAITNDSNFTTIRDGINGKGIGAQTDYNAGIMFDDSHIGTSNSASYYNQMSSSQKSICYIACPDDWNTKVFTRWGFHYVAPYKENIEREWVLQQFATLGFWFYTGNNPTAVDLENPDNNTHIPLFDDYGTTTGEYMSGATALTAPAAAWTNDVFSRDIYHGEPPYDPSNYDVDDTTIFNNEPIGNPSMNVYVYTQDNYNDPLAYLYATAFSSSDAQFAVKNFLSISPIDTIQSVVLFPLNIVEWTLATEYIYPYNASNMVNVVYGNVESDKQAYKLDYRTAIVDMGYIDIYRYFNDFRDYEPYTSIMLWLPFCGFTQIDCSAFMGKKLKIKYIIDFLTGGCTACVLANNLCVHTVNGQIGIQIPVTGQQTAQIRQAYDAAQMQFKQAQMSTTATIAGLAVGAFATVATGGTAAPLLAAGGVGAISTLTGAQKAGEKRDFELQHIATPLKSVGGTSSAIAFQQELTPRAIITRPKMLGTYDKNAFGNSNGFACCCSGKLSEFTGYTQCASINLDGINATADEKRQINELLLQGVIL